MTEANCLPESGLVTNLLSKPAGSILLFDGGIRDGFEQIDAALLLIAEAGETCAVAAIEEGAWIWSAGLRFTLPWQTHTT